MDGSYPGPQRVWEEPDLFSIPELYGPPGPEDAVQLTLKSNENDHPQDRADHLFAWEALRHRPKRGDQFGLEPFSLQWFQEIEHYRHERQAKWIPKVLEFGKHRGECLLCLGEGIGTDWVQFAENAASIQVCSSSTQQISVIKRHFQLRGLEARFLHGTPTNMPVPNASVDVVCMNGLLNSHGTPTAVVAEVFRVLRPGGKVIAVSYSKYDLKFWKSLLFFWQGWLEKEKSPGLVKFEKHSGQYLRKMFSQFDEHRISKRQLRRSEVPYLWRACPIPILERLIGRVLIVKAFKPVSIAIPVSAAA